MSGQFQVVEERWSLGGVKKKLYVNCTMEEKLIRPLGKELGAGS